MTALLNLQMLDVTLKKCCQAQRGKHEKKIFAVVWCACDTSWQHSHALSEVEDQIVNAACGHFEEIRPVCIY